MSNEQADEQRLTVAYLAAGSRSPGIDHDISVTSGDWEFTIEWMTLGRQPAVRVSAFDDGWQAFAEIPEFFRWLATDQATAGPGETPSLATVAAELTNAVNGRIRFTGYWPDGCGVVGDKRPEPPPHPPEHAPAYDRVARWYAAGCPVDLAWSPSDPDQDGSAYLRAGLPGWEG
jgi:hypothetical protein